MPNAVKGKPLGCLGQSTLDPLAGHALKFFSERATFSPRSPLTPLTLAAQRVLQRCISTKVIRECFWLVQITSPWILHPNPIPALKRSSRSEEERFEFDFS